MKIISFNQSVEGVPKEVHIVPIGEYKQRGVKITHKDCEDILRNFTAGGIKLVIDYEHQTLNSASNGKPAPAAGWINKLELREKGVYALDIEWTEEASELIKNKKYGYISPVIFFDDRDPHTDTWVGCTLHSVALTNAPYFRSDLEPIINARYTDNKPAEADKNKEKDMTLEEQIAALNAENKALADKNAELASKLAEKELALEQSITEKLVDDAIVAKKILPAQRETALFMANQGKEVFEKFVAATAVIGDLTNKENIPETAADESDDPGKEYAELLRNPAKAVAMKKENPERFNALRDKALYGGQ